jgi:predicted PurR-regulated permease PerM
MKVKLEAGWIHDALIVALTIWILHGFLQAMLAACVAAVASWPLYERFVSRLPRRTPPGAAALVFTCLMTLFVFGPLVFGFFALLTEGHRMLLEIAAADQKGIAVPPELGNLPWIGAWAAERWQASLAHPGALLAWTQRTDPATFLGWAQSLGQFMVRHLVIITFMILVLFSLYQTGESLSRSLRQMLRHLIGTRADGYADLATRALRASVNSILIVGLFDGLATGVAFAIAGVPRAALWAAIVGSLSLIPFLGYAAVAALAMHLAMTGPATSALFVFGSGLMVLVCGDKVVRPVVAGDATHLRFVWVLIGCLGGFQMLGLVGLMVGPVVLSLARELWQQRLRGIAPQGEPDPAPQPDRSA